MFYKEVETMLQRRERKDAAEHRRRILQTAQTLFNKHGVHSVSMHQIAKTAGIGQATLYRRYAHKGDLCTELMQDFSEQWMTRVAGYLEDNKQLDPSERLGELFNQWIDAIDEKSELIVTMESLPKCEDPRGNFFHSSMYNFLKSNISLLLQEKLGTEANKLLDTELTAHALICSMAPAGYFHLKQNMGYTSEQIKNGYKQLCNLAGSS
jgi:AcrR family transcriptional regulator